MNINTVIATMITGNVSLQGFIFPFKPNKAELFEDSFFWGEVKATLPSPFKKN